MTAPGGDILAIDRGDHIATVTLNRPEVINAFNDAIRSGLPALLASLDNDPAIHAIVLTGAGERGFCAGADIKEARATGSPIAERARLMASHWIDAIAAVRKPVIAAIHGICLGGGLELALACDIRVAAHDAIFGLPETALGLIPGGGGTQRLPRLIGRSMAIDMLLTGERIGAQDAYRIGLVTRLAATREAALAEATRLASLIASRPPAAIAYCKEAVIAGTDIALAAGLNIERSLFALLSGTADRAEAAAAFKEKRAPHFTGR